MPGSEQHGRRVLAVEADRPGAMTFHRNQRPIAAGIVLGHDRIGFGPVARNLAVDPAGSSELDPVHHAAPEIVQTPQVRDFPDRALDVVCCESRQRGPLAFPVPKPAPGSHRPASACASPKPYRRHRPTLRRRLAARKPRPAPGMSRAVMAANVASFPMCYGLESRARS